MDKDITILAIESSCDETAASVVVNGRDVLSNVISPDTNFQALKDLMKDLGLEMEDAIAL